MKLSVLICTYNRHELLDKALLSVVEGSLEKPDEIVVVNGGDEKADHVIAKFKGLYGISFKAIKTANKNLATSRNIGLSHCTGDVIAMTDDDAKVFPDWTIRMRTLHEEHPEAGAVGGLVIGTNTKSLIGKVSDLVTFPLFWKNATYVKTLPGVNISYKKSVLDQIGLQDVSLFRGEDVDYNWRVHLAGYKIYFDPTIKVYHHHRPTLKGFLNQHYMYGRAYYLVRKKWPEMYCIYPHGIHRFKDILKIINIGLSSFYQPVSNAFRLPGWVDRITALPLLFLSGILWKVGMLVQRFKENDK